MEQMKILAAIKLNAQLVRIQKTQVYFKGMKISFKNMKKLAIFTVNTVSN